MDREERKLTREKFLEDRVSKSGGRFLTGAFPVYTASTGVYAQDKAFGGGVPFGRILGWYGKSSTFKTTSVLRLMGEVNKMNWDTGELDLDYSNPCGGLFVDLEHSFDKTWAKKLGYDEDLPENEVVHIVGGELVGDTVTDAINSDMYSIIVIDSLESMMPLVISEDSLETNEQGRRAMLLAKSFRKWIPALVKSCKRNEETPWRAPILVSINHAVEKMMTQYLEYTIPGGNSQRFYASIEVIMNKLGYNNESKNDFGMGIVKGTIDKNKAFGGRGRIFQYEMALIDTDQVEAGQVNNIKSIMADLDDFGVKQKVSGGFEYFGTVYKTQKELKEKMQSEPEFLSEMWQKSIKIALKKTEG